MDLRKGQSAIEYLTTYGWMLVVVAIVGGAVFTTVQDSGQANSISGFEDDDVRVEKFGVSSNGLEAKLRAVATGQVENVNVSIVDPETNEVVRASEEVDISSMETDIITFPDVGVSEKTNTYDVEATYDTGSLKGLSAEGTLTGKIEINGTVPEDTSDSDNTLDTSNAVPVSGGNITSLATSSNFMNTSSEICVGANCSNTSGSETDEYVSRSGDEMTGTLFVDNITDLNETCFGDLCNFEKGNNSGYLGVDGNDMDGTLNVTEIKPHNADQLCAGTEC